MTHPKEPVNGSISDQNVIFLSKMLISFRPNCAGWPCMTNILFPGFQAMQEEAAAARLAQNEGASSADSASSGYMSPHFLRPPSPDDLHMQPRRSSDSGVDMPGHEVSHS